MEEEKEIVYLIQGSSGKDVEGSRAAGRGKKSQPSHLKQLHEVF